MFFLSTWSWDSTSLGRILKYALKSFTPYLPAYSSKKAWEKINPESVAEVRVGSSSCQSAHETSLQLRECWLCC